MKQIDYTEVGKLRAEKLPDGFYYIVDSNNRKIAINNKFPHAKTKSGCERKIMTLYKQMRRQAVKDSKGE